MNENSSIDIKDTTANPAPLGLLAFGMTTVLLHFHNAGIYALMPLFVCLIMFSFYLRF